MPPRRDFVWNPSPVLSEGKQCARPPCHLPWRAWRPPLNEKVGGRGANRYRHTYIRTFVRAHTYICLWTKFYEFIYTVLYIYIYILRNYLYSAVFIFKDANNIWVLVSPLPHSLPGTFCAPVAPGFCSPPPRPPGLLFREIVAFPPFRDCGAPCEGGRGAGGGGKDQRFIPPGGLGVPL